VEDSLADAAEEDLLGDRTRQHGGREHCGVDCELLAQLRMAREHEFVEPLDKELVPAFVEHAVEHSSDDLVQKHCPAGSVELRVELMKDVVSSLALRKQEVE